MTQRVRQLTLEEVGELHGLPAEVVARLTNYLELLLKWAKKINITGAKNAEALVNQHINDCLFLLPLLEPGRQIDVGAGGGFPSLVIACCEPERDITAVEPTHKKIAFLQTARRHLGLDNFTPVAKRVEDLAASELEFDLATSRATWALPHWLDVGSKLVRPGGLVLAMEGSEVHQLPYSVDRHSYELLDRTRSIVARRV